MSNSTSRIFDQIALKLDFAPNSWRKFGNAVGIPSEILQHFEMYTGFNPTEVLFRCLYAACGKAVKLSVIVGYLEQMNRKDILQDVKEMLKSIDMDETCAQDIFVLGSELLYRTSGRLNQSSPSKKDWRTLAKLLISDKYIDDRDIVSKLEPPYQYETKSPTKKFVEWLAETKPDVTIENLIATCESIKRTDAVKILIGHFSRSDEHILKGDGRCFGLPKPNTKMIGREKEKESLIKDILSEEHQLIVLHAATGYGKGTLAVSTAYELIEKHSYTCIYVSPEGILTVKDFANKILTTCGIPASSANEEEKVKELFIKVKRKCLLILDNFDHTFHAEKRLKRLNSVYSASNISIFETSSMPHESSIACNVEDRESVDDSTYFQADSTNNFPRMDLCGKEGYLKFIKEILRFGTNLQILATTWESFSVAVRVKQVELPALRREHSKELLIRRCMSVLEIERCDINDNDLDDVLKCCSDNPQLLLNAVTILARFGLDKGAERLTTSLPERRLELLSPNNLSQEERVNVCLDICFDRLPKTSQNALVRISVFPSFFSLEEAARIFEGIISNPDELDDDLVKLMDFSFLYYDQSRQAYYLSLAIKSFIIHRASSAASDSLENKFSGIYKGAFSRFVFYTFDITLKVENEFFSTSSANAIQRYRKQFENLKEIANWCISARHPSGDQDVNRIKHQIINSFIQCYLISVKVMETNFLRTILFGFSRICRGEKAAEWNDDTKKKSSKNSADKEYVECLIYGGVTCILGCLCVPQLCPFALDQAMWYFNQVLKALNADTENPKNHLVKVCDSNISDAAKTQFLLKYGKCLVLKGQKKDGLKFIQKGIEKRKTVFEDSRSIKDKVMVAVGYNDLASAYSYNNDSNERAILKREASVLLVYEQYLGPHPFTASAFSHLAHDYLALNLPKEALKACEKALSYRKALLGEHSETARSLYDMGLILKAQACQCASTEDKNIKYEEALSYLKQAREMQKHLAFTSDEMAQNRSEITDVLKSLGREDEAKVLIN